MDKGDQLRKCWEQRPALSGFPYGFWVCRSGEKLTPQRSVLMVGTGDKTGRGVVESFILVGCSIF
ncbi:MAG: hypothetical protein CME68_09595 [Halobacteriovoraceae bacterium]|nr:hypothetical protein [Halobacteriovoraceae bacterium]